MMVGRIGQAHGRRAAAAAPFAWVLLFLLAPLAIVFKISLATPLLAQPPFTPFWGESGLQASAANYLLLFEDPLYRQAFLASLRVALVSTLVCLAIGYPMAYAIARASPALRPVLLMLVVLPFWTSFLIRVYAWMGILNTTGLLNSALLGLGLIDAPLALLHTPFALHLGIVYGYLPFMVLPLYAALAGLDPRLLEAAGDLGAKPFRAFLAVTLPLSLPGVIAGSLLVFILAVGEFVIPDLLGGPDALMIGKVLWTEFFSNRDWPVAAALAFVLLVLLIGPILAAQRVRPATAGGR